MSRLAPIRVLAILPYIAGGGVERVVLSLAQQLDKSVIDFRLMLLERLPNALHEVPSDVSVTCAVEGPYRKSKLPHLVVAAVRAARHADVVLAASEGRAAGVAFVASRIARKPCVAMVHFDWDSFARDAGTWTMRSLRAYGHMDLVVSCSAGAEASIRRIASLHPEQSVVIQNGIPVGEIEARSKEPLPPGFETLFTKPTIVGVGRLSPEKGHDALIDAHAALVKRGIEHDLVIAGQGGLLADLKAHASRSGVSESVHFAGFQRNPFSFIRRATTFALTSHSEGFSLVVAEAMACGTPVVAMDCPSGPREILAGGRYGVLVPAGDVAALTDALGRVLTNQTERDRLRQLSVERCREFDIVATARRWESILVDLGAQDRRQAFTGVRRRQAWPRPEGHGLRSRDSISRSCVAST